MLSSPVTELGSGTAVMEQLSKDAVFESYRASLGRIDGKPVLAQSGLKAEAGPDGGRFVDLAFPAKLVSGVAGTYVVSLTGVKTDGAIQPLRSYMIVVRQ